MQVYQFVNYSTKKSLNEFENTNVITCFDLEDSLQDISQPQNTSLVKHNHRKILVQLLNKCSSKVRIGVRINSINSHEFLRDIECLSLIKNKIEVVFIPKAENLQVITRGLKAISDSNISIKEIVPVIETKCGMLNLEEIVNADSTFVKAIAFGHCDYNFDAGIFPFFHHQSREYWNWVEHICSVIKTCGTRFINSPVLELNNQQLFIEVIESLSSIYGINFGQITLTKLQTDLFLNHSFKNYALHKRYKYRLNLKTEREAAIQLINDFEKRNTEKSFAVTPEKNVLISPQEYRSAKHFLSKEKLPQFNFTFAGGCFPVQRNIPFDNLFHQKLKNRMEEDFNLQFNINIIRYELLCTVVNKINYQIQKIPADVLIFSIRPEPLLRLTKTYYKYIDRNGNLKKTINMGFTTMHQSEKADLLLLLPEINNTPQKQFGIKKLLVNMNYFTGFVTGNYWRARKKYLSVVYEVIKLCSEKGINCVMLGSPQRTNTFAEKFLSRKFNRFIQKKLNNLGEKFINGEIENSTINELIFMEGIYAPEKYHEIICNELYQRIKNLPFKTLQPLH